VVIPLVFMEDRVDGQRNSNGRQMRLDGLLDVLVVEVSFVFSCNELHFVVLLMVYRNCTGFAAE